MNKVSSINKYVSPINKNLFYKKLERGCYRMMNSKGEFVAEATVYPRYKAESFCYSEDVPCSIFHIARFDVFEEFQRQGYGSEFMKYLKRESYDTGCEGRVSLVAHSSRKAPHLFYWKQGFITPDIGVNKYFATCVKEGRDFQHYAAKDMYLPLKKEHRLREDAPFQEKNPQGGKGLKSKILGLYRILFG